MTESTESTCDLTTLTLTFDELCLLAMSLATYHRERPDSWAMHRDRAVGLSARVLAAVNA